MEPHPIRLTVTDDLRRSRLTVFFRLLLAIPHFVWLLLWGAFALLIAFVQWIVVLVSAKPSPELYGFLAAYVRYTTHVSAYVSLAANPFPGFVGKEGSYPVDVEIDPPARQNRWITGFRIFLALPALLLAGALVGAGGGRSSGYYYGGGIAATVAFLAWFSCLVRGRMPRGFRDAQAYVLRYSAQLDAYLFLLTDRYPDSDPSVETAPPPEHPVTMTVADDLRRSRLTVFFRLLLAIPHLLWLLLWALAAFLAALASWLVTLVRGYSPSPLHRFLAAYVRYATHVSAFLLLVGNPFPGFTGREGSYPVDVQIPAPTRQSRWVTGFRLLLAVPALLVQSALGGAGWTVAFLGWFAALVTGRMPRGFRNLGAYSLRYSAQTSAYLYVLTDRYPYSGPPA